MASNTGNNYRNGSVKDRIQVCNPITKVCTKYNTKTGEELDSKDGEYKGVAKCDDERSIDRIISFCLQDS